MHKDQKVFVVIWCILFAMCLILTFYKVRIGKPWLLSALLTAGTIYLLIKEVLAKWGPVYGEKEV